MTDVSYNEENRAKIVEVGERLLGTCGSVDTVIQEVFNDESLSVTDLDITLLEELDDITMLCESCGWYCDPGEMNDEQVCEDCERNGP